MTNQHATDKVDDTNIATNTHCSHFYTMVRGSYIRLDSKF